MQRCCTDVSSAWKHILQRDRSALIDPLRRRRHFLAASCVKFSQVLPHCSGFPPATLCGTSTALEGRMLGGKWPFASCPVPHCWRWCPEGRKNSLVWWLAAGGCLIQMPSLAQMALTFSSSPQAKGWIRWDSLAWFSHQHFSILPSRPRFPQTCCTNLFTPDHILLPSNSPWTQNSKTQKEGRDHRDHLIWILTWVPEPPKCPSRP